MIYRSALLVVGLVGALPAAAQSADDDWSGFYIGAEAGGASGKTNASSTDSVNQLTNVTVPGRGVVVVPGTTVTTSGSDTKWRLVYGGLIGGQIQTGTVILGIEADLHGPSGDVAATNASSATFTGTLLAPAGGGITVSRSARFSYDWSARARIGVALGSRTMAYVSGGIAGSRVRVSGQDVFSTPAGAAPPGTVGPFFNAPAVGPIVRSAASTSQSLTGWTAGGGLEAKLSKMIGIGLDGRYTHYGTRDFLLNQNATVSEPSLVINGTTYSGTGLGAYPGVTRVKLSEFRLAARVVFHF